MKKIMAFLMAGLMVLTIIGVCLPASSMYGQELGTIAGVVVNGYGDPLKGAKVTATAIDGSFEASVKTDANGAYSMEVPAGIYDVKATKLLYKPDSANNEEVLAGQTTILDFVLICRIPGSHPAGSPSST